MQRFNRQITGKSVTYWPDLDPLGLLADAIGEFGPAKVMKAMIFEELCEPAEPYNYRNLTSVLRSRYCGWTRSTHRCEWCSRWPKNSLSFRILCLLINCWLMVLEVMYPKNNATSSTIRQAIKYGHFS